MLSVAVSLAARFPRRNDPRTPPPPKSFADGVGGGGGSGTQNFVYQKWPKSRFPVVNSIVSHYEIWAQGGGVLVPQPPPLPPGDAELLSKPPRPPYSGCPMVHCTCLYVRSLFDGRLSRTMPRAEERGRRMGAAGGGGTTNSLTKTRCLLAETLSCWHQEQGPHLTHFFGPAPCSRLEGGNSPRVGKWGGCPPIGLGVNNCPHPSAHSLHRLLSSLLARLSSLLSMGSLCFS